MAKPIYAGSYPTRGRGRWKRVFIVVVLLQIAIVGILLYLKNDQGDTLEPGNSGVTPPPTANGETFLQAPDSPKIPTLGAGTSTVESRAAVADAQAAIAGGQWLDAKRILDEAVAKSPAPEAIQLLGEANMKLLMESPMLPGKERYTVQSGDALSKIAGKFNTTVALIMKMNALQSDLIHPGQTLFVLNSPFSIRVSKGENYLDLMLNQKLFKRYPVGTGKFGKTPAVEFKISSKIINPTWTRLTDKKKIEFGDPENVLGTRWMAIDSEADPTLTGFGIHGTWEPESIGMQSSAGCVRMLNEDVEELFDLVPRKTTVIITE